MLNLCPKLLKSRDLAWSPIDICTTLFHKKLQNLHFILDVMLSPQAAERGIDGCPLQTVKFIHCIDICTDRDKPFDDLELGFHDCGLEWSGIAVEEDIDVHAVLDENICVARDNEGRVLDDALNWRPTRNVHSRSTEMSGQRVDESMIAEIFSGKGGTEDSEWDTEGGLRSEWDVWWRGSKVGF